MTVEAYTFYFGNMSFKLLMMFRGRLGGYFCIENKKVINFFRSTCHLGKKISNGGEARVVVIVFGVLTKREGPVPAILWSPATTVLLKMSSAHVCVEIFAFLKPGDA